MNKTRNLFLASLLECPLQCLSGPNAFLMFFNISPSSLAQFIAHEDLFHVLHRRDNCDSCIQFFHAFKSEVGVIVFGK